MRRYFGFPVLAVGLAIGFHSHYSWLFGTADAPDARTTIIAKTSSTEAALPAVTDGSLAMLSADARDAVQLAVTGTHEVSASKEAPRDRRSPELVTGPTLAQRPMVRITSAKPADEFARYSLVRDMQRELKRVGCYSGEIDGSWGQDSKWALGALMDRVNASLPMAEPDYILLSLVKGQAAGICSAACPKGQSAVEGNRCVPDAIIAQNARRPSTPQAQTAWTTEVWPARGDATAYSRPVPLPGRMAVGGPVDAQGETQSVASDAAAGQEDFDQDATRTSLRTSEPAYRAPSRPARKTASRPSRSKTYGTRSVQRLFTNPLGVF